MSGISGGDKNQASQLLISNYKDFPYQFIENPQGTPVNILRISYDNFSPFSYALLRDILS
jgi:hypothetical protein